VDNEQFRVLDEYLENAQYDTPDIKGQHRRVLVNAMAGDRRYLLSMPGAGIYGEAVCGKCMRHGIDLSLLPECTTGAFGTGDKL